MTRAAIKQGDQQEKTMVPDVGQSELISDVGETH